MPLRISRHLKFLSLRWVSGVLVDIPYYIELQRRMFDIFRYVSCHEKNFETYSVSLESLLVGTCSFFDSQCQTFIREKSAAKHTFGQEAKVPEFGKKVYGSKNFNCGDYRELLEADFALSKNTVNLNPYEDAMYLNPLSYAPDAISGYPISPFKEWASGTSPFWWDAFTNLKHDRLTHHKEATLQSAIYALAAAFVILTLRNEKEFKDGHVTPELYDLYFPKYWTFKGRVSLMSFLWT
jgi:hypothetical protein